MSSPESTHYLTLDELRIGQFVHLDLSWLEHPFPSSNLKIKSADQIATIRSLGLQRVRWSPQLSDVIMPTDAAAQGSTESAADAEAEGGDTQPSPEIDAAWQAKREQAAWLAARHEAFKSCERELGEAARTLKSISRNLHAQPEQAREIARGVIEGLSAALLAEADVALHLMADKAGGETIYHHALNVSLLSMMLAREMKAPASAIQTIGLGALLHDIGKFEIPDRLWRQTEPYTRAELALVQTHGRAGVQLGHKMQLPADVLAVLEHHHELCDGSGYPKKLKGAAIPLYARIVTIANVYDNLCNPVNPDAALTPHEALSNMFGLQRAKFDARALETFVRCMGIYPPGSLVVLSDGSIGMVVSVNASRPLKPTVMVHDPQVPKEAALLLELEEHPDLRISETLRPKDLTPEALAYLAPRQRMSYFPQSQPQR